MPAPNGIYFPPKGVKMISVKRAGIKEPKIQNFRLGSGDIFVPLIFGAIH